MKVRKALWWARDQRWGLRLLLPDLTVAPPLRRESASPQRRSQGCNSKTERKREVINLATAGTGEKSGLLEES